MEVRADCELARASPHLRQIADTLKLEDGPDIDVEEFHHDIPQSSIVSMATLILAKLCH
jgi:hypothetical protein